MQQHTPAPTFRAASPRELIAQGEGTYPAPPKNWGQTPPFGALASLYNKLSRERQHDKRRKAIDTWFEQWRKVVGPDLYPAIRLLLPDKDRERIVYWMKEKNLAKSYIKIIPLENKSPDAIRLMNWKRPTEQHKASGDFTSVLLEVISQRSNVLDGSLTVADVNTLLDELSQSGNKQDKQADVMKKIYARSTPDEQRWIARIILRDMGISVKETTIFSVYHPDAHDLFNTCCDLKKVCWELWDPRRRLNEDEKTVKLFRAFTPMLCKRPTRLLEDSVKDMGGKTFIIEEKLDGERIQLHKRGNEFFYCSRKAKDYTYLYGKHIGEGSLTPHIAECFDPRVEDIVLDGELLVWDPVSERHLPFGTLKTAAINKSATYKDPRPCFRIFDMLYLNGQSLINKSLKFRKRNMKACVREKPGYLEYILESEGKTVKDIRDKMEEVLENRGEGLVLKHPDSEYVLNGRNKDWVKVKPEYMDSMSETLDLLVVAGHYGSGKRGGGVSSLICAVRDDRSGAESEEPLYSTFIRVGTGLSLADYVWIREKPWKKRTPTQRCAAVRTAPENVGAEDKGDLYLDPEDSFLISVKAADITPSDQYHLNYTLRFPRALRTREDLPISDCATVTSVLNIVRNGKKRKTEEEDGQLLKRRKKSSVPKKAPPTMLGVLKGVDLKNVQVESDIFEDMTFVVSADPKSKNRDAEKTELLKLIKANGGRFFQVAKNQPDLLVVYGGSTTPYDLKMIINKDVHDIIRPQWLLDCVAAGERLPLTKKYFFHATEERKNTREYKQYVPGDSDGSDTEAEDEDEDEPQSAPRSKPPSPTEPESPHATQTLDEEDVIVDPSLQDWFQVRDDRPAPGGDKDEDSATDPESDNDDTRDEEDDWFGVRTPDTLDDDVPKAVSQLDVDGQKTIDGDFVDVAQDHAPIDETVGMGETDDAMTYDEHRIFTHLRFYLDTPSNACRNGMKVATKHETAIEKSLASIGALITENGGRVTGLNDPKLTHVVLDKRDTSRRRELMQRTSQPKRRHLVLADFIEACLEESTLLDEAEFAP